MIVFVDGVDGSGKTTLINRLLDQLATQGRAAVVAPPLWTFLEPITDPNDFAHWVRTTPGVDVARHLLLAMQRRLHKLRTDLDHGIIDSATVVLVDRGPKTITCSARAHACTGLRSPDAQPDPASRLDEPKHRIAAEVSSLIAAAPIGAVELRTDGNIDLILTRLAALEDLPPPYVTYLRIFTDEMATAPPWPALPSCPLHSSGSLATNAAKALTWIES